MCPFLFFFDRDLISSGFPGLAFKSGTGGTVAADGSGIGQPAADELALYTSNNTALTERVRIDNNGNVGIGTNDPNRALEVYSTTSDKIWLNGGTTQNGMVYKSAGSGDEFYTYSSASGFGVYNNTDSVQAITVTNGNYVGIGGGATAPESVLQVGSTTQQGDVTLYGDLFRKEFSKIYALSNVNDIFIYDTSKDPDGGKWTRGRTDLQLSWYTETKDDGPGDACSISTDDRCGTSEFPAKAVLVTTNSGLYIFDANTLNLWMKFTQDGTYALGGDSNNNPSGVSAAMPPKPLIGAPEPLIKIVE
jgi:hypothetical protein